MKKKLTSVLLTISLLGLCVAPEAGALTAYAKTPTKEESVSIKADASGAPYRVTSENILAVKTVRGAIRDASTLTDIKNRDGDEEYRIEDDGEMVWDNHGADIRYEGDADASDLPFALHISYYLNGKKVAPQEIAGQSGSVRVRFYYENLTKGDDYVPFLFMTAALLDSEVFSDIEVENGSVSRMSDYLIVTGFAFPGLQDALQLSAYEATKEIDLPEYLEITADAEAFEMDFTATMVSNGLFADLDVDDLDDLAELSDGMAELEDASKKMADAAAKLYDGAGSFRTGLTAYTNGAAQLSDGARALYDGLSTINDNMGQLSGGAQALSEGLSQLNAGLSQVDLSALSGGGGSQMQAATGAAKQITDGAQALQTALAALQGQLAAADTSALQAALQSIATTAGALQAQVNELQGKIDGIDTSLGALNAQIASLDATINALNGAGDTTNAAALQQTKNDLTGAASDISASLNAAKGELSAQKAALEAQAISISQTVSALAASLSSASTSVDTTPVTNALTAIQQGFQTLTPMMQSMSGLSSQMAGLSGQVAELKNGVAQLAQGGKALSDGVGALSDGVGKLTDGAKQLTDGAGALKSNGGALVSGYDALYAGIDEFANGLREFDEEAIGKLSDLAGDELSDVIDALRKVKVADDAYTTFSGAANGYKTSVRFLIETDAVKP